MTSTDPNDYHIAKHYNILANMNFPIRYLPIQSFQNMVLLSSVSKFFKV